MAIKAYVRGKFLGLKTGVSQKTGEQWCQAQFACEENYKGVDISPVQQTKPNMNIFVRDGGLDVSKLVVGQMYNLTASFYSQDRGMGIDYISHSPLGNSN